MLFDFFAREVLLRAATVECRRAEALRPNAPANENLIAISMRSAESGAVARAPNSAEIATLIDHIDEPMHSVLERVRHSESVDELEHGGYQLRSP